MYVYFKNDRGGYFKNDRGGAAPCDEAGFAAVVARDPQPP